MSLMTFIKNKSSFNVVVISATLLLALSVLAAALLWPQWLQASLNVLQKGIFSHFSWFYILVVSGFLFFLIFLCFGSFGRIKLGSNEEVPEFSFLSWLAMLFAAGMGVGLMFFGVAEPLLHVTSPTISGNVEQVQQSAMLHTLFHWGIHAWAIYGVVALALAYFSFRYRLPLALRSCFYPFLGKHIHGKAGDAVDTMALCATLFGIITTLGLGAAQMGAGLEQLGWIEKNGLSTQVFIIIVVMALAVFSAISGVGKGVKQLSEINFVLAILLMLFVLFAGPTLHLLLAFSDNIGIYLSNVLRLSFKTFAYESKNTNWLTGWTVLYWAWWCSWAPFVGLFIARVSRGRTIREFVFGVLVIPSLFSILWFTIFGNSAIWIDQNIVQGALQTMAGVPEKLLFVFLDQLPFSTVSSVLALAVCALFFITSADSGIYVLNNIASRDKGMASPRWQTLMWGVLISAVAIALLSNGGLQAIQAMMLIVALPFSMLMLIMCFCLLKALMVDQLYFSAKLTPASVFWSGQHWRQRLGQMMNQMQAQDTVAFLNNMALPAMAEVRQELVEKYGLHAEVMTFFETPEPAVQLVIKKETMRDFMYGIKSVQRKVPQHLLDEKMLPHIQNNVINELVTYFGDGRDSYDVQYMSQEELIADILKQYERYLFLLGHVGKEMLSHEQYALAE